MNVLLSIPGKSRTYVVCSIYYLCLAVILLNANSCSKIVNSDQLKTYKSGLADLEYTISNFNFSVASPAFDTINTALFRVIRNSEVSKSNTSREVFLYDIQTWFSKYPIEDVNEMDSLISQSFLRLTINRSLTEKLAICDLYIEFINTEKVCEADKKRLLLPISLYRDLAIHFEGDKIIDTKSDELVDFEDFDEGKRNRAYWLQRCGPAYKNTWSDCWDCCMKEFWEDLGFTDYVQMGVSLFFPWMGWKMLQCGEDCFRTEEEIEDEQY